MVTSFDNTVGRHIRRCNRNQLLVGALSVCVGIPFVALFSSGLFLSQYSKQWWESVKLVLAGVTIGGFGFYQIWISWKTAENILAAPAIAWISHFGVPPWDVAAEIQREIDLHGNLLKAKEITLTPSWLLKTDFWEIEVLNLNELLWIFASAKWHLYGCFPWRKKQVVLFDRHGRYLEFEDGYEIRKQLVLKLQELAPWVQCGTKREFKKHFAKGIDVLIREAQGRRKATSFGNPTDQVARAVNVTVGAWNKSVWWPSVLAGLMCLVAVLPLPYGYFQFLRWLVAIISGVGMMRAFTLGIYALGWCLLAICILFNPILPFHLEKGTWKVIDFVSGGALLSYSLIANRYGNHDQRKAP